MRTPQTAASQMCRTLAHSTRLQLLWNVFEDEELCVREVAIYTGISEPNASNQLRELAAKELIIRKRGKLKVFYKPTGRPEPLFVKTLIPVLKRCHDDEVSFETIIHDATAFTHDRRIQIARCLAASDEAVDSLLKKRV
ncbi:MAG: winged helix-turn-helix transcriptional regulator [Kiritimatiellales bacterium]|nr:winged helix-turn-helix transcriptional regulator [Kiritimatiellota bacterium]MBL7012506.1 winged helix-turn-helix transcriptional regulator [Kiritimatiellales bacterium]